MLHFSKLKAFGIILAVLVAIVMALPNVLPAKYQDMLRPYGLRPMTLGLDLQGGVNILLEIDRDDLKKRLTEQLVGGPATTIGAPQAMASRMGRPKPSYSERLTKAGQPAYKRGSSASSTNPTR